MLFALSFVLALATPAPTASPSPAPTPTPTAAPSATATPCGPSGSGCGGPPVAGSHQEPNPTPDPVSSRPGFVPTPSPTPSPATRLFVYRTWPVSEIGTPGLPKLAASQLAEAQRVSAALGAQASLLMFAIPNDTFVLYVRDPSQVLTAGVTRGVIGSHCRLAYRVEPGNGELVTLTPRPLMKCIETAADRAADS